MGANQATEEAALAAAPASDTGNVATLLILKTDTSMNWILQEAKYKTTNRTSFKMLPTNRERRSGIWNTVPEKIIYNGKMEISKI